MSQIATGTLIFEDGASARDFVAVSAGTAMNDLYEFRTVSTSSYGNGTQLQTKVISGQNSVVLAQLEWLSRQIGSVTILLTRPPIQQPGASFCLPGPTPGSRSFFMDQNGVRAQYTWTKKGSSYELTGPGNALLARYDRTSAPHQKPPHATMSYYFNDKLLLLMALISLALNRWLDGPSSPLSSSR